MRSIPGILWRLFVILAVIAAPLFIIHRSQCIEDGERVDSWSLVAPWNDPPSDCRDHQNGFEVLEDELGL
ncbi:MAG TPA: hypothetical protein VD790_11670 [Thermoleophilaceae bacterium]|nr:hypothetical protein [Thermoleophilaceae bacterium]